MAIYESALFTSEDVNDRIIASLQNTHLFEDGSGQATFSRTFV